MKKKFTMDKYISDEMLQYSSIDSMLTLREDEEDIEESGFWSIIKANSKVYIESSDFTHDVVLEIYGDFININQKEYYAKEICRRLNKFNNK